MLKNTIELPCKIGDEIFIVEDYNQHYDECEYYETIYDTKITIKRSIIECFIIDDEGIFIGEDGHDGFNKLTTYHNLTLEDYNVCKIFYTIFLTLRFKTVNIKINKL